MHKYSTYFSLARVRIYTERMAGLSMSVLFSVSVYCQSLCDTLSGDTSYSRVTFTARIGSPFQDNDSRYSSYAIWYSFGIRGIDLLNEFLHTVPDGRKNIQWVPSANTIGDHSQLLDGTYIVDRSGYHAMYRFEMGFLVTIYQFTGNGFIVTDFSLVNHCCLPIISQTTVLRPARPFSKEHSTETVAIVYTCDDGWAMYSSLFPSYIRSKLCRH